MVISKDLMELMSLIEKYLVDLLSGFTCCQACLLFFIMIGFFAVYLVLDGLT